MNAINVSCIHKVEKHIKMMKRKMEDIKKSPNRISLKKRKKIEVHEMKKAIFEIEKIILDAINNRL